MSQRRAQTFPRSYRVLRKVEFDRIIRRGVHASDARLRLRALAREPGEPSRLGITIGRRAGNAVVRNRVRRLLREVFRLHHDRLPSGLDIVVFPGLQRGETPPGRDEVAESLLALSRQAEERLARRAGGAGRTGGTGGRRPSAPKGEGR